MPTGDAPAAAANLAAYLAAHDAASAETRELLQALPHPSGE
jgi:hypothetical protein